MPYATGTTPFTGDNDITDFMTNVYVPFARDDCKWSDNQAPVSSPANRFWLHRVERGGSPIATLSPFTPKPPYIFFETNGYQMAHYTGSGIDTTLDSHNQPGNPNNYWDLAGLQAAADLSTYTYINGRGILTQNLVGTFQKYWLFSNETGDYIHCVIQPRAREYRHFHIGLLTPMHPELPEGSFYITGHFWDSLYANLTSDTGADQRNFQEHQPYITGNRDPGHRIAFHQQAEGAESFGLPKTDWVGTLLYIPGYTTETWFRPTESDLLTTARGSIAANRASPDQTDPGPYGVCNLNGYGNGLGATLWAADKTFTSNTNSLVPIFAAVNVSFASLNRFGVVAQIPDMYRVNMRDYSPGEEIAVGSDTYVVFPVINDDAANALTGEGYSGYEGWAYKKITATVP